MSVDGGPKVNPGFSPRGFIRNLVDIGLCAVAIALLPVALSALFPPTTPFAKVISFFGVPVAAVAFIWLLLRFQGQRFRNIGLQRVDPFDTILQGVALAALLFSISLATEAMGLVRDFSSMRSKLEGQPFALLLYVIYAFIGAGFYEELAFRGFALDRFARMLGGSRGAWIAAAVLQAMLFGFAHAYQGAYGIAYTGAIGALFPVVLFFNGRNLWALVLGHGLYDAARFIFFYVIWTYPGR